MSEPQLLNLALTVIPMMTIVLAGILVNHSRLADVRDLLRSEIDSLRSEMRTEIGSVRTELRVEIGSVRGEMGCLRGEMASLRDVLRAEMERNHNEMLHRFGDLDSRMTRIENGLGMKRGG